MRPEGFLESLSEKDKKAMGIDTSTPEDKSANKNQRWQELENKMVDSELSQEYQEMIIDLYENNETLQGVFKYLDKKIGTRTQDFIEDNLLFDNDFLEAMERVENMSNEEQRSLANDSILDTYPGYKDDLTTNELDPFDKMYGAHQENMASETQVRRNNLADVLSKEVTRVSGSAEMLQMFADEEDATGKESEHIASN